MSQGTILIIGGGGKTGARGNARLRARGGDYIGLAAAADGSFHPVWVDARDGVYQVYTARIEVRR